MQCEIRSFIGTRERQEDAADYLIDERGLFAVVCDGIGSRSCGMESSELAVKILIRDYKTHTFDYFPKFIIDAAEQTDNELFERFGRKCGTTAVAAYIKENELYWFSVGDSRLYIFRNGRVKQITKDHNYHYILEEKMQKHIIDAETYKAEYPKGNQLISFLGMNAPELVDMNFEPLILAENDVLIITTDGLYRSVPEYRICDIVNENNSISVTADKLLDEVKKQDTELDNTTFAIIKDFRRDRYET